MPVTYEFDQDNMLIRTKCSGDLTFAEVLDHFRQLEADASLPPRLNVLLDLTESESIPETDQLHSVVGQVDRLRGRVEWGACAIVANRDVLYGMTRVFEVLAEGQFAESCVVRSLDDAETWLGERLPSAG